MFRPAETAVYCRGCVEGFLDHRPDRPLPSYRWYVAWHPDAPEAIIRAKDARGLQGWRDRDWYSFPGDPRIEDVTESVAGLFAALAGSVGGKPLRGRLRRANGGRHVRLDRCTVRLRVLDGRAEVVLRPVDSAPLRGEMASLDGSFHSQLHNIRGDHNAPPPCCP